MYAFMMNNAPCILFGVPACLQFKLRIPLRSAEQIRRAVLGEGGGEGGGAGGAAGRGATANYLLTFIDDSMLIGRATGTGGTFIFQRELEPQPAN